MASKIETDFYKSLGELIKKVAKPPKAAAARRVGRPVKSRMETVPVILHLYRDQVAWLDDYADYLAALSPENGRLSRVEMVRGLLMALAEYAYKHRVEFSEDTVIRTESDFQAAVVRALEA